MIRLMINLKSTIDILWDFTNDHGVIITQTPAKCLITRKDKNRFDQFLKEIIKDFKNVLMADFPDSYHEIKFNIGFERLFIDIKFSDSCDKNQWLLNLQRYTDKRYSEKGMFQNTFYFKTQTNSYMVWFDLFFYAPSQYAAIIKNIKESGPGSSHWDDYLNLRKGLINLVK